MNFINQYIIGNSVPVVLIFAGLFFLLYLSGRPILTVKKLIKIMFRSSKTDKEGTESSVSPFRSMTMALAGTLGVGNIVGVAGAIALGGFGSIFWMWVTALAAMILKYAEIVLAIAYRKKSKNGEIKGGAVYYIRGAMEKLKMPRLGKVLSIAFAVLCILDSISMGCVVQVNAVSSAMKGVLNVPTWVSGLIILLLTAIVISKGSQKISGLTEWLVPIMSVGYIIMSVAVIVLCRNRLGESIELIFREAFNFRSTGGGIVGFLTADSIRYGSMRGLLSNEAGCGTAPFAHASSRVKEPAGQGVWGIFEVFADTILLCTMTAAVIIINYDACCAFSHDGVMMTVRAFSSVLGSGAEYFLCIAVFLFAYATVICWAQYGIACVTYLTYRMTEGKQRLAKYAFICVFCICTFIGSVIAPSEIWTVADFSIGSMTLINVFVLCLAASEVKQYTDRVFKNKGTITN